MKKDCEKEMMKYYALLKFSNIKVYFKILHCVQLHDIEFLVFSFSFSNNENATLAFATIARFN